MRPRAAKRSSFTGTAWFDHQWGNFANVPSASHWDWFSCRFDDRTELMLYRFRDGHMNGTAVDSRRPGPARDRVHREAGRARVACSGPHVASRLEAGRSGKAPDRASARDRPRPALPQYARCPRSGRAPSTATGTKTGTASLRRPADGALPHRCLARAAQPAARGGDARVRARARGARLRRDLVRRGCGDEGVLHSGLDAPRLDAARRRGERDPEHLRPRPDGGGERRSRALRRVPWPLPARDRRQPRPERRGARARLRPAARHHARLPRRHGRPRSTVRPRPPEPAPTVLAALGPKMLALSAERTRGAHPYFTPPEHTAMAREVMGEGPLLAPEQAFVLETRPGGRPREGAGAHGLLPRARQLPPQPRCASGSPRTSSKAAAATGSSTRSWPGAASTRSATACRPTWTRAPTTSACRRSATTLWASSGSSHRR